ncbi:MAG: glycosyltransferase family 2 protein [Planctomycetota bacterium]|nr:glycosyltransferase family 2 protein [Planctomycetota bacterium]
MAQAAMFCFWVLFGLVVGQTLLVLGFVRALRGRMRSGSEPSYTPQTAVILCLRGTDPFLSECLDGLLQQDFPHYAVWIVIDQPDDPAWGVVREALTRHPAVPVQVLSLTERRETCSLKCSSLTQAVALLDASYEVVALLDADTVPHRMWLRELVAPLADSQVGAATGNRWYMPAEPSWGSLVRYTWNSAAIVQMYWYSIPWGGALAVRTAVFRQSNLLERWRSAFCEDTMLYRVLREIGFRVAFAPSLMMVNREACDLPGCLGWVRRQLLTARLYHPGWPAVVVHGVATAAAQAVWLALLLAAGTARHWSAVAWLVAGGACYWSSMAVLLGLLELGVRQVVHRRGEPVQWLKLRFVVRLLVAIPWTQVVYPLALLSAMLLRRVEWRGAVYRVDGPWHIRLIEDRPAEARRAAGQSGRSL